VTHQTASPITANACPRSLALTRPSRRVVSCMAVKAQRSALVPVSCGLRGASSQFSLPHFCWCLVAWFQFSRFQATRQRAEQKRACSRFGSNSLPQRSHRLLSAIRTCYA